MYVCVHEVLQVCECMYVCMGCCRCVNVCMCAWGVAGV